MATAINDDFYTAQVDVYLRKTGERYLTIHHETISPEAMRDYLSYWFSPRSRWNTQEEYPVNPCCVMIRKNGRLISYHELGLKYQK